ncbi:hypothetical protein FACS1894184_00910 [Clostridia bacterium]|nr:hypothetical protein FACS1894184_00910 [Clostridia bacterium]
MRLSRSRQSAAFIAILLCLAFTLGGCKLISKDPNVDAKTVIAEVGGDTVTKGELTGPFALMLSQYAQMYAMYGLSVDTSDAEFIKAVKESTLSSVTSQKVRAQQFASRGLELTADEEAHAAADADEAYESWITSYVSSLQQTTSSLSESAARDQAIKELDTQGLTRDMILQSARDVQISDKLKEEVTKDVTISDADIEAAADTRRTEQKTKYDATPASYSTDAMNGLTILYRPEGYRYVKNLLVGLPDETRTEIESINTQLSNNAYNRYSLEQQKASFGTLTEADEQTFNSLLVSLDEIDADLNTQMADALSKGKEQIKARAEEALAAAKADGADFDALIVKYGTDPGMQEEPFKTTGYPVSESTTSFVTEFKDAAMALAKPGDISELVETNNGYHIVQYASDIPAGDVPTADVKDALSDELLTARKDEQYNQAMTDWTTAANIKTYISRWD